MIATSYTVLPEFIGFTKLISEERVAFFFFLSVSVVLAHAYWTERRHRRSRETAEREYARATILKQQQLQTQFQAQQEVLFNSMIEGVLVLDQQGQIQILNQSLKLLLEVKADIRGFSVMEAFNDAKLDALSKRLLQECTATRIELEFNCVPPRFIQVNGSAVLDQQGRQRGAIMVFHDLTRLKQLERTRQEFVANVSHELRTPLSMIKGFVETLLSGAKDDPAVATRFLQNINKHADRLTFLIEDLLTISRLESGNVLFNMRDTDLRDLVERVLEDLKTRDPSKAMNFINEVPEGLMVWADSDRLQQVLFNLVDNAIKYGRRQGNITISVFEKSPDEIQVSVKDDGPGIPPEACERVFERFYRVDKARSREQGGTGLGLAIIKHIVQRHGGRVWVESQIGKGATFFFTLPLHPSDNPDSAESDSEKIADSNSRRIFNRP